MHESTSPGTVHPPAPSPRTIDTGAPVLDIRGLTKRFGAGEDARCAVDGVDLAVHAGEVVALLGPNGAGKTTTIRMSAGLVVPTDGRVRIVGEDVGRHRGAAVQHLGAVLEGGRNVYWPLSAWQNLLYFGRLRGLRRRDIAPRAQWLLEELGLWNRRHEPVGTFSRGMQQKVAVAAALVTDPALLLLDEPTIGLDVAAARTVKTWIRRLATEDGRAVVLTTHQLEVAQELSDRAAVIRDGRIVADLPVGELLDQFRDDRVEIQVRTLPNSVAEELPDDSQLVARDDQQPTIVVPDGNQATVYRVLEILARHQLPLVSVAPVRPDLEDVFLQLVGEGP